MVTPSSSAALTTATDCSNVARLAWPRRLFPPQPKQARLTIRPVRPRRTISILVPPLPLTPYLDERCSWKEELVHLRKQLAGAEGLRHVAVAPGRLRLGLVS